MALHLSDTYSYPTQPTANNQQPCRSLRSLCNSQQPLSLRFAPLGKQAGQAPTPVDTTDFYL